MVVVAGNLLHVQSDSGMASYRPKEFLDGLRRQIPNLFASEWYVPKEVSAPANIDRDKDQRIVHRRSGVAISSNLILLVKRLRNTLPKHNSHIFDEMVFVDF